MDLDHPIVTELNRKGYLNALGQEECCGFDVYGDEILAGDEIVIDENGELILKDNLERYLSEVCGFQFKQAE